MQNLQVCLKQQASNKLETRFPSSPILGCSPAEWHYVMPEEYYCLAVSATNPGAAATILDCLLLRHPNPQGWINRGRCWP